MRTSKEIHFISGLPRSGSTLLANLLMQNPRFHATPTSGLVDALVLVRNQWDSLETFTAAPNDTGKLNFMRGAFSHYFDNIERPVVFDKNRAWLAYAEMAESLLGRRPKFIVTVRDVRDVLASFEKLWRKGSAIRPLSQERAFSAKWATIEGRCEIWCDQAQVVGASYNWIKDAQARGRGDAMYFVRFGDLTTRPMETLQGIYAFLDEPLFIHDPLHVQRLTQPEFDHVRAMPGLHDIREEVRPVRSDWREVLGSAGEKYAELDFWNEKPSLVERVIEANNGRVEVKVRA